jgi:ABC-type transporter Mla MlaB component
MPTSGSHEVAFAIRGPIRRADLPGLCDRVCAVLAESTTVVVDCDVASVDPDAVTVDALARLQLAATRRGCAVRLQSASEQLVELVELMGLTHVLCERTCGALLRELEREPEARKKRGGIEEKGELDDASVLDLEHL